MPESNPIYAIVGDNGYGMTIKLEKAREIVRMLRNCHVKKFFDVMSAYIWLSSQINDYNEAFYNNTRVLEPDDLVSINDLIRQQYVVIPDSELKRRNRIRKHDSDGTLHIVFGEPDAKNRLTQSENDNDASDDLETATRAFLKKLEKHRLKN